MSTRYCRRCGTSLLPDSNFCPSCGTAQQVIEGMTGESNHPAQGDMGTGRLPAGKLLYNRYRLLHAVGRGGMGAVYVAQDTQLGDRLVAIKEMSMSRLSSSEIPQAVEQFKQEAHLLASLHHPNLPVIHEYFGEENRWYLVMSFIQGETLMAHLNATTAKKLTVQEVVRIGLELCSVLDYLHTHQPQIIFRDLKPQNIMITAQGQIYLIDFGIARHFKQDQNKDTVYYYSVGYAPPEQYGQGQTGPRSDIYSLGVTLHQVLTGHNPTSNPFHFPALQTLDPTIPVPLVRLISSMLELNETNRPPSIAAVKQALQQIGVPQTSPTKPAKPLSTRKSRLAGMLTSSRTRRFAGSLVPIIAGIILVLLFRGQALDNGLNEAPYILLAGGLGLALAGLAFLLPSRPVLNAGKGIVLMLAGGVLLLPIFLDASANDGISLLNSNNAYQPGTIAALVICLVLVGLGAFWLWRRANLATGIIAGSLTAILGIIFLLISDTQYSMPYVQQFIIDTYRPNIGLLACVGLITLGVTTPLIIRLRRQQSVSC